MRDVIVVIGAGSIGQAIARRVSAGKHVLLADLRRENADAAAEVSVNAGFEVSTATVDVSSRDSVHALVETAASLGDVVGVIHAAGVSPSQATPAVDPRGRSATAPHWCSRNSATSSPPADPASSSPRSPDTASARSPPSKTTALATTPTDELLPCRCCNPTR